MKFILKFKDGITASLDLSGEKITYSGNGNLLELMLKGKENNSIIEATDTETGQKITKRYTDLYSLEIVFVD